MVVRVLETILERVVIDIGDRVGFYVVDTHRLELEIRSKRDYKQRELFFVHFLRRYKNIRNLFKNI